MDFLGPKKSTFPWSPMMSPTLRDRVRKVWLNQTTSMGPESSETTAFWMSLRLRVNSFLIDSILPMVVTVSPGWTVKREEIWDRSS